MQEWLLAMAASGYIDHLGDGQFALSPEQYQIFCNPDSPAYVAGGFQGMTAATRALDRLTAAFRSGEGMGWHEHHPDLFTGTERFFRPSCVNLLTSAWLPAVEGLPERLEAGARVAESGAATVRPRASSPRPTPPRASPARTTTRLRSTWRG